MCCFAEIVVVDALPSDEDEHDVAKMATAHDIATTWAFEDLGVAVIDLTLATMRPELLA